MESSYKFAVKSFLTPQSEVGLDPDELDSQSLWLCLQCVGRSIREDRGSRGRNGRSGVAPAPGSRPLYLVLMRSMVSCTWFAVGYS